MNNKLLIVAGVLAAVVIGVVAYKPNLGGDWAGGIPPTNVVTATTNGGLLGNGSVSPVGSFALNAANGLSVGNSDQYHGVTTYVSASGTPASVIALNAFGTATGTQATTTITVPETAGLAVGDICSGGVATGTAYISGCFLTSTNGATGTAIVAYANGTAASLSLPTSTRINISFEHLPY